jgi:glycosyltransferase involved in cell wall biosynthesis
MIVVTFKGAPAPLVGKIRDWAVSYEKGSSVAEAIASALDRFKNEPNGWIFVTPGGRIRSARTFPIMCAADWDVAAHVDRIGRIPQNPCTFDGVGRISLRTVLFKRTPASLRVLERWRARNAITLDREAINLAISLAEVRETRFQFLPRTWIWNEQEMRSLDPVAESVIDFSPHAPIVASEPKKQDLAPAPPPKPAPPPVHKPRGPEVLWNGHFYSYASYGKINRETLLRTANSVAVKIDGSTSEIVLVDEYTRARLDPYKATLIGPRAPFLRFFGPDFRPPTGRHRINWTLMETHGKVHADMAKQVNDSYDELWVCTEWNAATFKASGVRVPISVVPLGIDRAVYRPQKRRKLPPCRLLSTGKRATIASPSGFIFLSVGLPSPRKGFEVIADALEMAFGPRADVDLVVASTHGQTAWTMKLAAHVARSKVRVWILEGRFNEHEMSGIYAASDAYVSASIGEGWNLPAHEASACLKPVIVPRNSVHPEIFGEDAFVFDVDGVGRMPEVEPVSPWYVGMEFSLLRTKATRNLADAMLAVRDDSHKVRSKVQLLNDRLSSLTWDATASNVTRRLIEVQP